MIPSCSMLTNLKDAHAAQVQAAKGSLTLGAAYYHQGRATGMLEGARQALQAAATKLREAHGSYRGPWRAVIEAMAVDLESDIRWLDGAIVEGRE